MGWPVSASHNRTVVSSLAEARRCPSGLNATVPHGVGVAGERCADRLAGVGVPQPHRVVPAGGGQAVPVGAERHTGHGLGVPGQGLVGVPEPDGVVDAGGNESMPVGAERDAGQRVGVPGQWWPEGLAGVGVP